MRAKLIATAVALAALLAITLSAPGGARGQTPQQPATGPSPFDSLAMWIHELPKSSGGNPAAIGAQARASGIGTVIIKTAHGPTVFGGGQFNSGLVTQLHAQGLKVCAYQRMLGANPLGEAKRALESIAAGADCFVIDAEAEYEGKYRQAQTYMRALRKGAGAAFPIGFTGFPYMQFHQRFPFSVFLGPGGATANLPQIYWKAIGDSVDKAFAITYRDNPVYGRDIYPLGQLYESPPLGQVRRATTLASKYGAKGMSWWVWQLAGKRGFNTIKPLQPAAKKIQHAWPSLGAGAKGDLVVWAQQHLLDAGLLSKVDGSMGAATKKALASFQGAHSLRPTGVLDAATWPVLLSAQKPAAVTWPAKGPARAAPTAP